MNSDISIIINQHLEQDGTIVFRADSFNRLKGFEFNVNSPLVDSLLTIPRISFEDGKVHINIPPFNIAKNIRFPEDTYKVTIHIQPIFFNLSKGLGLRAQPYYIDLEKTTALTEECTFSYNFPPGSVCIIGLSLVFISNQLAFNNKNFNPAGIVWARYKEGIADDENDGGWYNTGFKIDV
ncbi:MAG: hypothetical protein EOO93_29995 [Pedobacter sp.]|nr:MAG: hypothetical protein EOO93_29995 [Pedobacter sp.]